MSDITALGLLPAPVSVVLGQGTVLLPHRAAVAAAPALAPAARWWRRVTEESFGLEIVPVRVDGVLDDAADVTFVVDDGLPTGGYRLNVGDPSGRVRVAAADLAGAHAAAQALRQLAGPGAYRRAAVGGEPELPACTVRDAPRFAWRGVLLDVARHFLPKADVLRFVDLAAAHRLTVLQLHLVDDQGWRFESRRHPLLTQVASWRRESTVGTWRTGSGDGTPHGGWYTHDDLREIVAYARERGVTVVPEIDVPGHVQAVLTAYPHLAARGGDREVRTTWGISDDVLAPTEEALEFFRDVLDEVCDVFDGPYVGIGGDEVPTTAWAERPDLVARAASLGYRTPDGAGDVGRLHGWFLARLAEHLGTRGRRAVVWDEGFSPELPTDTIVTCWRGWAVAADALAAGHDVVLAPEQMTYLDHRASDGPDEPVPVGFVRTVEDVYGFEPLPAAFRATRPDLDGPGVGDVLGAQAQVWTEHLDSARRVDYAAFPRLAAFAEAVWLPAARDAAERAPGSAASGEFVRRLRDAHLPRLAAYGVEYRPLAGPHPWQRRPGVEGFARDLDAELAAGGWAGVGGWVDEPSEAGTAGAEPAAS
ncbi:family 20 glycosylhydrolase [Isoptericola sp. NEAU-Y5]|uniref:beta-N-acetylhexosaminidase n=1 Tax=Isoptericola luteus TaxID=2879484 RepID=A0ABS7ZEC6_9MICO|nr:family 20 glycosylhydrolase [Isoptericola sp. NEAU-Y5]MCA5893395.1 family 20 glycosylhydrolase [Isoptericola sp. NEAU-Y5]